MHPIQRSAAYILIREVMATSRVSVEQLAAFIGVQPRTVIRCARAEKRLPRAAQWRLAALGVSLCGEGHVVARRARQLRAQLEAQGRYERRGANASSAPSPGWRL
jgi:hypothetical protein